MSDEHNAAQRDLEVALKELAEAVCRTAYALPSYAIAEHWLAIAEERVRPAHDRLSALLGSEKHQAYLGPLSPQEVADIMDERERLRNVLELYADALQTYAEGDPADPDTWSGPRLAQKTLSLRPWPEATE